MTQHTRQEPDTLRPSGTRDAAEKPQTLHDVEHSPAAPSGVRGTLSNIAVPIVLIVAATGIGAALLSSPPHIPKSEPGTLAPVVGLAELVPQDTEVFVEAYGTVVPSREIRVTPEVSGRIIELNERLEPGGLLSAGELLFRIDPTDYRIAVDQAEADLSVTQHGVAQLEARIETLRSRGRQLDVEIAYSRWNAERLGRLAEQNSAGESEAREAGTSLESQRAARRTLDAEIAEQERAVESAAAGVRVAERRLEAARLALRRTEVTVPFDSLVVSESIEIGQLVGPQTAVARLVATDEFWAEAVIPVARLEDVRFALDHPDSPSLVAVSQATGDGGSVLEGVALRPLGSLDPLGRMARVLVSIRDPLGLADDRQGPERRLFLGSYLRVRIEAGTLQGVFSIPRKGLRENDRVWVRDAGGRLAIRPVRIVWRRHDDVLVRDGFEPGDRLVTTHLASVVPGMPLRVRDGASAAAEAASRPTSEPTAGSFPQETADAGP